MQRQNSEEPAHSYLKLNPKVAVHVAAHHYATLKGQFAVGVKIDDIL